MQAQRRPPDAAAQLDALRLNIFILKYYLLTKDRNKPPRTTGFPSRFGVLHGPWIDAMGQQHSIHATKGEARLNRANQHSVTPCRFCRSRTCLWTPRI